MRSRIAVGVAGLFLGIGIGYAAWGIPSAALEAALAHTAQEEDRLRTQLARKTRECDVLSGQLARIVESLGEQRDATFELGDMLQRLSGQADQKLAGALEDCRAGELKLQQQLEQCLFARADLERRAAARAREETRPRSGTAPVVETVVVPQVPTPRPPGESSQSTK